MADPLGIVPEDWTRDQAHMGERFSSPDGKVQIIYAEVRDTADYSTAADSTIKAGTDKGCRVTETSETSGVALRACTLSSGRLIMAMTVLAAAAPDGDSVLAALVPAPTIDPSRLPMSAPGHRTGASAERRVS